VLLIDCDLRKPAFKSPSQQSGLTKLLTNDESLVEHVAQTQFPNLWLLPSGAIPPNPADLLSTGRFRSLLREASAQFDMVIVDAPPVIGLADAPLIASMCKDAMFVIESGKTRTSVAREAVSKLHSAGAHVVGATLTKAVQTSSAYGYGYGYGYGDRKYGEIDRDRPQVALFADESEA
jgi:capsular exopolysaccharide synthesis family protein